MAGRAESRRPPSGSPEPEAKRREKFFEIFRIFLLPRGAGAASLNESTRFHHRDGRSSYLATTCQHVALRADKPTSDVMYPTGRRASPAANKRRGAVVPIVAWCSTWHRGAHASPMPASKVRPTPIGPAAAGRRSAPSTIGRRGIPSCVRGLPVTRKVHFARSTYSPVRVSTRTTSPGPRKAGTRIFTPVSSTASFG